MSTQEETLSLGQRRARHAWEAIKSAKDRNREELRSLVRRVPSLIRTNGFGQTIAFLASKKQNEHEWLLGQLTDWLLSKSGFFSPVKTISLLEWLTTEATMYDYRRATAEALEYLRWLKRFAEAELS